MKSYTYIPELLTVNKNLWQMFPVEKGLIDLSTANSSTVKSFCPPVIWKGDLGMDLKSLGVLLDNVYVAGRTVASPQHWF